MCLPARCTTFHSPASTFEELARQRSYEPVRSRCIRFNPGQRGAQAAKLDGTIYDVVTFVSHTILSASTQHGPYSDSGMVQRSSGLDTSFSPVYKNETNEFDRCDVSLRHETGS